MPPHDDDAAAHISVEPQLTAAVQANLTPSL
jgi:hypothetical protein